MNSTKSFVKFTVERIIDICSQREERKDEHLYQNFWKKTTIFWHYAVFKDIVENLVYVIVFQFDSYETIQDVY